MMQQSGSCASGSRKDKITTSKLFSEKCDSFKLQFQYAGTWGCSPQEQGNSDIRNHENNQFFKERSKNVQKMVNRLLLHVILVILVGLGSRAEPNEPDARQLTKITISSCRGSITITFWQMVIYLINAGTWGTAPKPENLDLIKKESSAIVCTSVFISLVNLMGRILGYSPSPPQRPITKMVRLKKRQSTF